ncbi:SMI1/KNR4 family protein [Actinoplanes sp. KI2]|uniref:SMI1/KNR4 family protein n=1 Tax=Actinoplanes sp. KI2 TaxID=2983315 RepID=UPI0021D5DC68|nr:SMI1/KNR4 family protein [Actinoplanes sp. KI2]MCU7731175.1 SMI1/KNR4 family protein [Actinoplanes sp. KI2]
MTVNGRGLFAGRPPRTAHASQRARAAVRETLSHDVNGCLLEVTIVWIEVVVSACPEAELAPPVNAEAISDIERRLGDSVPADLRALLFETDGVLGEYALDVVWTAKRIAEDNARFRADASFAELYQPFDGLLFFGDNGGGDQFAFVVDDPRAGVVVWEHETDCRRKVADGLADYLRQILSSDGDEWYDQR